jgi:hypothetical protein
MELPVYAKYCPNCGVQVHSLHEHHELSVNKGPDAEARARHLARMFAPIYHVIELRLEDVRVDKLELISTVQRIESELLRGEECNAARVERWLRFFKEVAPDMLKPITAVLLRPETETPPAIYQLARRYTAQPVMVA